MPPRKKKDPPASTPPPATMPPACRHLRTIAEPVKVPDQVAFRCLDCDADLPYDFASPAN